MEFVNWLKSLQEFQQLWVMEVFIIVLTTLICAFVVRKLFKGLLRKAEKTKNQWDDALIVAAMAPAHWVVWLIGIRWAIDAVHVQVESVTLIDHLPLISEILFVVLLTWFLVRFIRRSEMNLLIKGDDGKGMDETTVFAMGKLLRISVLITATLVVMQSLGYSISGILAFGGVGGIAVGFAAKDLLANFFGGLMIYMDRPFKVGDWIRSPDQDIEGTVEDIGWRLTRIRTFDQRPLYIPNSTFTHISVENPSRMTNRRIYETVGIRYDDADKVNPIIESVKQMLLEHPEIAQDKTLIVNLNSFAPSALEFFVYTFTKTTDWVSFHEIKQDVMLKILDIIAEHEAECAFPTSTLHIPNTVPVQLDK